MVLKKKRRVKFSPYFLLPRPSWEKGSVQGPCISPGSCESESLASSRLCNKPLDILLKGWKRKAWGDATPQDFLSTCQQKNDYRGVPNRLQATSVALRPIYMREECNGILRNPIIIAIRWTKEYFKDSNHVPRGSPSGYLSTIDNNTYT